MSNVNPPIRILIADDHPLLREGVAAVLEQEPDFQLVAEACDGREAVEQFLHHLPDVTLMDLEMPGMNTLELFPILKKDFSKLPVIIVSGHYADLNQEFENKGFNYKAFFNKPISVGVLRDKVREILKIDSPQKI